MKRFFTFKNLGIFSLIYTIITIVVSIINIVKGQNYDHLGYWHEIDRALILLLLFILFFTIKYFHFSSNIANMLSQLLPLLLALLTYASLLNFRGFIPLDLFKKILFFSLLALLCFFLLKWLLNTFFNLIDTLSKSKSLNKIRFELLGFLLILLLVLPFALYFIFKEDSSFIKIYTDNLFYIIIFILLIILAVGILLTTKRKNKVGYAEFIMIIIYYIFFILLYFDFVNIYLILLLQFFGLMPIIIYSLRNKYSFNVALAVFIYLIMILSALKYFTNFLG